MPHHQEQFSDAGLVQSEPSHDWTLLEGKHVKIYTQELLVDQGAVDAVTADGLILWLQQNGPQSRRIVQKQADTQIHLLTLSPTPTGQRTPPHRETAGGVLPGDPQTSEETPVTCAGPVDGHSEHF